MKPINTATCSDNDWITEESNNIHIQHIEIVTFTTGGGHGIQ